MQRRTRARLSLAMREFVAARPWRHLRPTHLFGLRDEDAGRLACAAILGAEARGPGLILALGEGGFDLCGAMRGGGIEGEDFLRNAALLTAFSHGPDQARVPVRQGVALGRWGRLRLVATFKAGWGEYRTLTEAEGEFLSRALRAATRWAGPAAARSFLAPAPVFPVISLSGPWKSLRLRETMEAAPGRADRRPPPLVLPEALLSSLPSRPREGTLVVRFFRDALPRSEPPFELLTMYFLPGTVPVAMELLPAEGSVLAAGKHLVKLLAMPGFPAPRRLETDCAAFLQHGGEALGEAGIDARDNEGLPPEREVLLRIKAHLERES